jgi:hypothetical protein
MKSAQIDIKEYRYFVNKQWREAADNKFFEVREPYSGNLFARELNPVTVIAFTGTEKSKCKEN